MKQPIYTLHKIKESFIVTSNEAIQKEDLVLDDKFQIFEVDYIDAYTKINPWKKVIAQQDQIDFSSLSEEEQKEIKTPVKIEGYFENKIFKITKIWENY